MVATRKQRMDQNLIFTQLPQLRRQETYHDYFSKVVQHQKFLQICRQCKTKYKNQLIFINIQLNNQQINSLIDLIMKNIELFGDNGEKKEKNNENPDSPVRQRENSPSRLNARRPEKLVVSKNFTPNQKWRQCKIIGKNISIRSYSASCTFRNKFYVYGGYQILKGILSDFYCIDLDDNTDKFQWQQIQSKGEQPGPRSKHALIGGKNRIYLVCGLSSDTHSSNQIFEYDAQKRKWSKLNPEGDKLPQIDSFGCVYLTVGEQQKIIITCGYDGKNAEYLNSVYEYNITKNKISTLFQSTKITEKKQPVDKTVPTPRTGCAAATDGKNVYIFGGKDLQTRMNDLWEFNLIDFKYRQMDKQGQLPPQRNGHTMQFFQGKLYVFGGIHDITWQLDDLHIYSLAKKKWTTLQHDSPRKIQKKKPAENASKQKDKKSPKKKNWYDTSNSLYNNKSTLNDSPSFRHGNASTTQHKQKQDQNTNNPLKMIEEQKKKAFLNKKSEMLKNFQVPKNQTGRYVVLEAESQAIKNSLDVIGDPDPRLKNIQGRITDFGKQSMSKFLQPLNNNSNLIVGKKPCARDGHCSAILNQELIVFGGDRHQMSFNDIYKLNFGVVEKSGQLEGIQ